MSCDDWVRARGAFQMPNGWLFPPTGVEPAMPKRLGKGQLGLPHAQRRTVTRGIEPHTFRCYPLSRRHPSHSGLDTRSWTADGYAPSSRPCRGRVFLLHQEPKSG